MLRIAGFSTVFFVTGCLVSSDGGNNNGTHDDMLGRVCTMQLAVTGTFVESMPAPLNPDGTAYVGCWPIGTWTFTAAKGTTDCKTEPALLSQYQFRADYSLDADGNGQQSYTYMTDPSVRNRLKVSQGGDGLCEGELNLFSADGTEVWILKPELYADKHLGGDGEYQLYKSDQWIGM